MPGPYKEADEVVIVDRAVDLIWPNDYPSYGLYTAYARAEDFVRLFKTTAYYREAHWGDAYSGYPVALAEFLMELGVIEDPR